MDDAFAVIELASGFKIDGGDIDQLNKAIKSKLGAKLTNRVSANSKTSPKTQYLYEIKDKATGQVRKTGVTSGKVRQDGKAYRAEKQVRKHGEDKYESQIVGVVPSQENARKKVLDIEIENANLHRETLLKKMHLRP